MTGGPDAQQIFTQARAAHRAGRISEAEQGFRAALAQDGQHADAMEWLGALCLQTARQAEAIDWLSKAAAAKPDAAGFHDNLTAALMQAGRIADAAKVCRASLALADTAPTRMMLGQLLHRLGQQDEAMGLFESVLRRDPVLHQQCRNPDAQADGTARNQVLIANARYILARYPLYAPAWYAMACAFEELGQMEDAQKACAEAIARNPGLPVYYHIPLKKRGALRDGAIAALERMDGARHIPPDGEAMRHFLLGQSYSEDGKPEAAFTHLHKANQIKRSLISYDEQTALAHLDAIAAQYSAEYLAAMRGHGDACDTPIFIIGMPRSGTSLIEQILASHPDVYGAGELTILPDLVKNLGPTPTGDALAQLGQRYGQKLSAIAPNARHIVDKMPMNFLHAGLIHLALPRAKFIHVQRDALDTCFSCYSLMFAGDLPFTYDLGELGRYYRGYEKLMAHWQDVLPAGTILDIPYEDVITDLEGQARRLIAHCGLDWDARCLNFHENKRAVSTASLYQVRQPIYRTSVGKAKAYERWLTPLTAALEGP